MKITSSPDALSEQALAEALEIINAKKGEKALNYNINEQIERVLEEDANLL